MWSCHHYCRAGFGSTYSFTLQRYIGAGRIIVPLRLTFGGVEGVRNTVTAHQSCAAAQLVSLVRPARVSALILYRLLTAAEGHGGRSSRSSQSLNCK